MYRSLNLFRIFGAMSYNFYFISGRNLASTVQALQQVPKAQPEPRPRPVLQLIDHSPRPEIAPLAEANVQARTPDPRPRNRDILSQRAASVRDDASIRDHRSHRSRSHRSRIPGRESTQATGQITFPPPPPPIESHHRDNGIKMFRESGISMGNQCFHHHQLRLIPKLGIHLLLWHLNPDLQVFLILQTGQSPPVPPEASRSFSVFHLPGTQQVPRPPPPPPSGDPVIPVENLMDTSISTNVTPNQTEFRAWIKDGFI